MDYTIVYQYTIILFILGRNSIFCHISRKCHQKVLQKIFAERAAFLLNLLVVRIIQKSSNIYRKWLILYDKFCRQIQKHAFFLCKTIDFEKQSVGGAFKVLPKPVKTILGEDFFTVNLFYQIPIKNEKMTWNISQVIYTLDDL